MSELIEKYIIEWKMPNWADWVYYMKYNNLADAKQGKMLLNASDGNEYRVVYCLKEVID
jgi:predicted nucleotide-binding protein (sugar kinase/HSP70/actin superfamily)